jgi:hypothetical protein
MCIKAFPVGSQEADVIRDMKTTLDRVCGKTECDWGCEGCPLVFDYTDCDDGVVGCQCLKNILNEIEAKVSHE